MSQWLKQSTTVTVRLGPALDVTDGATEETGVSPTVYVSKGNGAYVVRNSATAITHDLNGWYAVELDATDTATLGNFTAMFRDPATHLPVWKEFLVVPANVFDSFLGADALQVDVTQWDGTAAPALVGGRLDVNVGGMAANTVTASALATDAVGEIADGVLDEAITEPTAVPTWAGATLRTLIGWMGALSRNKLTQTSTVQTLRDDADASDIATAAVSTDGTTFTRAEFVDGV